MADAVVGCPDVPEGVLAADVPDLEVHVWEIEGADILADGGDGGFGIGQGEDGCSPVKELRSLAE